MAGRWEGRGPSAKENTPACQSGLQGRLCNWSTEGPYNLSGEERALWEPYQSRKKYVGRDWHQDWALLCLITWWNIQLVLPHLQMPQEVSIGRKPGIEPCVWDWHWRQRAGWTASQGQRDVWEEEELTSPCKETDKGPQRWEGNRTRILQEGVVSVVSGFLEVKKQTEKHPWPLPRRGLGRPWEISVCLRSGHWKTEQVMHEAEEHGEQSGHRTRDGTTWHLVLRLACRTWRMLVFSNDQL